MRAYRIVAKPAALQMDINSSSGALMSVFWVKKMLVSGLNCLIGLIERRRKGQGSKHVVLLREI